MSVDSTSPQNTDPYGSSGTLHEENGYISVSQELVQRNFSQRGFTNDVSLVFRTDCPMFDMYLHFG